jgi:hypothetical protein
MIRGWNPDLAGPRVGAMRSHLPIILGGILTACVQAPLVAYVPPEEAAWFKFPDEVPEAGQQAIPGVMATAIQLAVDDFLPRDRGLPSAASPQEVCLQQRQSYDVEVSPGAGDIIWVSIMLSSGACTWGPGPLLDIGATYAVDTSKWRVVAVNSP